MTEPARRAATAPGVIPASDQKVAVWLGADSPTRSVRWLDGVLAAAAKIGDATAVAAGDPTWLDLAADRSVRARIASVGIATELHLDYLGWAQIAAAAARELRAVIVLVDEVSRPERAPEVAAIADLLDAAQLTRVVALSPDGMAIEATRSNGAEVQQMRVTGPAVLGVRIAGPPVDEYPTPMPSTTMRRLELSQLGLDPAVLGHRGLPARASQQARKTAERIAEYLALHVAPVRGRPRTGG